MLCVLAWRKAGTHRGAGRSALVALFYDALFGAAIASGCVAHIALLVALHNSIATLSQPPHHLKAHQSLVPRFTVP